LTSRNFFRGLAKPLRSLQESFKKFGRDLELRNKETDEWGFPESLSPDFHRKMKKRYGELPEFPEGVITFRQAVETRVCELHKTEKGLKKFLESVGYPAWALELQAITKFGYQVAIEKMKQKRRDKDAERKRVSRAGKSHRPQEKAKSFPEKITALADA
jgi:hypothetical protein